MRHILTFAGKDLWDFGVHISGEDTWKKPSADYEAVSIPGRNGDLLFFNNRYNNVEMKYPCGIISSFDTNFSAMADFLLSHTGYQRLEDSYHPDCYRLAYFSGSLDPELTKRNREGKFDLVFTAKPQRFLKKGEQKSTLTADGSVYNPTSFDAKPLIRVYGTGQLGVGDETVTIKQAAVYTDLDCEAEDAYKDSAANNCNGNIELSGDSFPVLKAGRNGISLGSGITKVEITPRWWRL